MQTEQENYIKLYSRITVKALRGARKEIISHLGECQRERCGGVGVPGYGAHSLWV